LINWLIDHWHIAQLIPMFAAQKITMELKNIASLSGKSGLFKIVSPTKSGVILESLDEAKTKLVTSSNQRVSILSEISIFTTTKEGNIPLLEVLKKIKKDFTGNLGVDANSEPKELKAFLKSVLPEYDEAKVYVSDMKKLVKWYGILSQYAPEVFETETENKKNPEEGKS